MENESLFQEGGGGSKETLRLPGKGVAVTSQSRHGRSWKPLLAPAQLCPAVPSSSCLPTVTHTTSLCPKRASSHQTRDRFSLLSPAFVTDKLRALSCGAVTNSTRG